MQQSKTLQTHVFSDHWATFKPGGTAGPVNCSRRGRSSLRRSAIRATRSRSFSWMIANNPLHRECRLPLFLAIGESY